MEIKPDSLSLRKIFVFWLPLAATWLMMAAEGPFLAALIARLAEPKYNLAAYGVAFSFALIIEAPVIMIMSASTALVKDFSTYIKLRNFTFGLSLAITAVMFLFIIPPVFYFIAEDLIGLPPEVSRLTHIATVILLPWPGTIGYRRFYQGVLIRSNLTKRVAYGTVIRLSTMALTAVGFYLFTNVDGVIVGASSLSAAVTLEAVASRLMVHSTLKKMKDEEIKLSYKQIWDFYLPLALTSLITLGVHPLVVFFMGQSRMALESLAVLPVLNSFVFIFRSMGLSFQEVGIALMGDHHENYYMLKKFGWVMGITVVSVLAVVAFTPLSSIWFNDVSGLSLELSSLAHNPLIILVIMPGLTVLISFQRAVLVEAKNTKPITLATVIEFAGIVVVLFILIKYFSAIGITAAAAAFIIGRLGANLYLAKPHIETVKNYPAK